MMTIFDTLFLICVAAGVASIVMMVMALGDD